MPLDSDWRVYSEQVRIVCKNTPLGIVATVINSGIVTTLHWNLVPRKILLAWFIALVVLSVVRLAVSRRCLEISSASKIIQRCARMFEAGIILSGVLWGSSAAFSLFHNSQPHEMLVAYVLGGMSAGAAGTFSVLRLAYYAFIIPALVPQMVLFLLEGEPVYVAMAGMLLLFGIIISISAEHNYRLGTQSLHLRYENHDLVLDLQKQIRKREIVETDLRQSRADLEQKVQERTSELSAFTHSVSHDLRAPLHAIDGFGRILEMDYGESLDEEGRKYLSGILKSADRMRELIEDLLLLSRISQAEIQRAPTDLSGLVLRITEDLKAHNPDREVTFEIEEGVFCECDQRLVQVALENLFGNAWKYTAKSQYAHIGFGMKKEHTNEIFFVTDNGIGLDMTQAKRIFEPFARLHKQSEYPGSGIGLATVQRVTQRHGGSVWVESEPGKGATFFFTLRPKRPF